MNALRSAVSLRVLREQPQWQLLAATNAAPILAVLRATLFEGDSVLPGSVLQARARAARTRRAAVMKRGHAVSLPWLRDARVVVWGDIVTQGFAILVRAHGARPRAESILMDNPTLLGHRPLWGEESQPYSGPVRTRLSDSERIVSKTGSSVDGRAHAAGASACRGLSSLAAISAL